MLTSFVLPSLMSLALSAAPAPAAETDKPGALPRVLVMLAEQNLSENAKYWWNSGASLGADFEAAENAMAEQLKAKGFTVVDRRVLAGKVTISPAIASAEPNDSAIKEFALQSGAEVVVIGKAVAVDSGKVMNTPMHSIQATLSMRVLNLDDARILASGATTQVFAHVDPTAGSIKALQKAVAKASDDMLPKVLEAWRARVQKFVVTIHSVKDWKRARELTNKLGVLGQVKKVSQRSYKAAKLELEVEYAGKSDAFADVVVGSDAKLQVDGVTANTVALMDAAR